MNIENIENRQKHDCRKAERDYLQIRILEMNLLKYYVNWL